MVQLQLPLFSLLSWYFLPNFATQLLLRVIYSLQPTLRPTVQPQSPPHVVVKENERAQTHYRWARIGVIVAYLVWSLWSSYSTVFNTPNFYTSLQLPVGVALEETLGAGAEGFDGAGVNFSNGAREVVNLKSHWKRLARVYHPDKVGPAGEERFIAMRGAYEVLSDPVKRYAYDRFGPDVAQWTKCSTAREFMMEGLSKSVGFYGISVASLLLFSYMQNNENVSFWRNLTLLFIISSEFFILIRSPSSVSSSLSFPSLTIFERATLLRQIFIAASCAISQLGPFIFPPSNTSSGSNDGREAAQGAIRAEMDVLMPLLDRVRALTVVGNIEALKLLRQDLQPLMPPAPPSAASLSNTPDQRTIQELSVDTSDELNPRLSSPTSRDSIGLVEEVKEKMLDLYCDLKLKSHPEGKPVWDTLTRRKWLEDYRRHGTPTPNSSKVAKGAWSSIWKEDPESRSLKAPALTPNRSAASIGLPSPTPSPPSSPVIVDRPLSNGSAPL